MEVRLIGFEAMLDGYVDCALWSSLDSSDDAGGSTLDALYSALDIDEATREQMCKDCQDFIDQDEDDIRAYLETRSESDLGHDFWLTRNGHGAGFWDRGLGLLGERLTMRAKTFGEVDLYATDDGKVSAL